MAKELRALILIIDDELELASKIKDYLEKNNYTAQILSDGVEALRVIRDIEPDLILLDWLLPEKNGIDICKELRKTPKVANTPVIMLSARGRCFEKIIGLDNGADDYLAKPFSYSELLARVKALLRRIRPIFANTKLIYNDIEVDPMKHKALKGNKEIKLAPIEFQILQILLERPEKVISRQTLMNKIWGVNTYVEERTIDVHITRLRKAIIRVSNDKENIIKTVRSAGYKIEIPCKMI
jgi:two-component system phosphate regulon response regulator PhoB